MKKINNDLEAMQALINGEVLQYVSKGEEIRDTWELNANNIINISIDSCDVERNLPTNYDHIYTGFVKQKMIKLGNYEYPEPIRNRDEFSKLGNYCVPSLRSALFFDDCDNTESEHDYRNLGSGIVHKNKGGAIAQAKAMIAFFKNAKGE